MRSLSPPSSDGYRSLQVTVVFSPAHIQEPALLSYGISRLACILAASWLFQDFQDTPTVIPLFASTGVSAIGLVDSMSSSSPVDL
jgi:hypothetical protein